MLNTLLPVVYVFFRGVSLVGVGKSCQLLASIATEEEEGGRILKEFLSLSLALSQLLRSAEPRDKVRGTPLRPHL